MPSFITYSQTASGPSWSNASNATGSNNSTYAWLSSGITPGRLVLTNFDNIDTTLDDPNYTINKITVEVTAQASGSPGSTQRFKLWLTEDGSTKDTDYMFVVNTPTTGHVTTGNFYWKTDGSRFKRPDIRNNSNFGCIIESDGAFSGSGGISMVKLTIDYTDSEYAQGEHSKFPVSTSISPVTNASNPSELATGFVITHEQLNTLSDTIVTIQKACLGDENTLMGLGPGVLYLGLDSAPDLLSPTYYLMTILVTGNNYSEYFNRSSFTISGSSVLNSSNQSSTVSGLSHTTPIAVPVSSGHTHIDLVHCSGQGWVQTSTGYIPLHVSPNVTFYSSGSVQYSSTVSYTHVGYHIGYTALPLIFATNTTPTAFSNSDNEPSLPSATEYGKLGSYSGNDSFTIKILALGRAVNY